MPELPEVETIRRQLAPRVGGATLDAHRGPRSALVRAARTGGPGRGASRAARSRRWAAAASTWTGAARTSPSADAPAHDGHAAARSRRRGAAHPRRARASTATRVLSFVDPRRFGTGELVLGDAALEAFFAARLGVEPFDDAFTAAALRALARGRRGPIKPFLLDQRNVAGVGNIYADEALFRAGVHPLRARRVACARPSTGSCATRCARRSRPGSRRAARRSTTTATSTACAGASRTASSCTCARASRVRAARRRSASSSSAGAAPTSAALPAGAAARGRRRDGRGRGARLRPASAQCATSSQAAGAVGLGELGEAADELLADDDLRERHHPCTGARARRAPRRPSRG